jgi:hypothetical protein
MIPLQQKLLLPVALFGGSICFLPITTCVIGMILQFDIAFVIVFACIALIYIASLIGVKIFCARRGSYLRLDEDELTVYFYADGKQKCFSVKNEDLVVFHYLRLFSPKSWLAIAHSYILPRSVFVEYCTPTGTQITHIGYLDHKQLKQIAKQKGVNISY